MNKYKIYTDGAFSPLTKSGGIAFIIINNDKIVCEYFKKFTNTTSQRMEQLAVAIALESIKESSDIEIYSDSAYVVNTYEQNWKRKEYETWDEAFRGMSPVVRQQSVRVAAYTQALFVQALVDQAQASKDDRIAVLYVGNPAVLTAHRAVLERSFVLRCANGSAFEPAVNEEVSAI